MKVVTVVGARPQFIKAAAISRAIREQKDSTLSEVLVHTGQHYDANMSDVFFKDLDLPAPAYNLEISGGTHGAMTGRMLTAVESVLIKEAPDWLLVYGDTNSTLAGALAAVKLHIPVAHVESGLRSFNFRMPEEINRIVTDRVSSLLLCPTAAAIKNLADEGLSRYAHNVGDVMYDVALFYGARARNSNTIFEKLDIAPGHYALATCHRAENTDDRQRLTGILRALTTIAEKLPVVIPMHPRTKKIITDYGLDNLAAQLRIIEPAPFLDMTALEQSAAFILTDSGGVQKEAFFYQVPCITMREETEWVETVASGWNQLAGAESSRILAAVERVTRDIPHDKPYGDGQASHAIVQLLLDQYPG